MRCLCAATAASAWLWPSLAGIYQPQGKKETVGQETTAKKKHGQDSRFFFSRKRDETLNLKGIYQYNNNTPFWGGQALRTQTPDVVRAE